MQTLDAAPPLGGKCYINNNNKEFFATIIVTWLDFLTGIRLINSAKYKNMVTPCCSPYHETPAPDPALNWYRDPQLEEMIDIR